MPTTDSLNCEQTRKPADPLVIAAPAFNLPLNYRSSAHATPADLEGCPQFNPLPGAEQEGIVVGKLFHVQVL